MLRNLSTELLVEECPEVELPLVQPWEKRIMAYITTAMLLIVGPTFAQFAAESYASRMHARYVVGLYMVEEPKREQQLLFVLESLGAAYSVLKKHPEWIREPVKRRSNRPVRKIRRAT